MKIIPHKLTVKWAFLIAGTIISVSSPAQDGAQIFQSNCAVCHKTTDAKSVGPGMAGVTDRRSTQWLKSWIRDSQGLIASGDADAKAVFAAYNNSAMPPFPQFSDTEMDALVTYLGTLSGNNAVADTTPKIEIVYTDIEITEGRKLFTGEKSFFSQGPSCITCHDVNADGVTGGFLAKDLTDVYTRLGDEGIMAIVSNAPFPAMNSAYANNPVNQHEQRSIVAFLKSVSQNQAESRTPGIVWMSAVGFGGFLVIIILIAFTWRKRKKDSVKADIFARQIRSIN